MSFYLAAYKTTACIKLIGFINLLLGTIFYN